MATDTADTAVSGSNETVLPSSGGKRRRIGVGLLIVLASLLLFGTATEVWVKNQLLSTPQWLKASDKMLAEPSVQAALSDYIIDEIYSNVDVQKELADQLPEGWKGLSAPIAVGLRSPATSAVEKILSTNQVATVWHTVNEKAHQTLVNVLEDKTKVGSTKDGKVTLDIGEIVRIVGTDLGLPQGVMDKVPSNVGQITIFESSDLATIQQGIKFLRILGPILAVLILGMYVGAVWLDRGRRRLTLRNVGWSILIVGVLLAVIRRFTGTHVDSFAQDPIYALAVKFIFSVVTEILYDAAWLLTSWGALVILAMVLSGPTRIATAIRKFIAPVINVDKLVFWIGAAAIYLGFFLWFPSPALRVWWSFLALAVIGAGYLHVYRGRSLAQFPDAGLDVDVDGLQALAVGAWGNVTSRFGSGASANDDVSKLQNLADLHKSGALTDEEFVSAKSKILS